jgi:hypothetical protein
MNTIVTSEHFIAAENTTKSTETFKKLRISFLGAHFAYILLSQHAPSQI